METLKKEFKSLVNGNTHIGAHGIVGTDHETRKDIWERFRCYYPHTLTVKINGVTIELKANHSESGKTTNYTGVISNEDYIAIIGSDAGLVKKKGAFIVIGNGVVSVRSSTSEFKIDNNRVEII